MAVLIQTTSAHNGSNTRALLYRAVAAILVLILLTAAPVQAGTQEYRVKAAFLYNFAKFIQWPANTFKNADEPLQIAILGQNPFNSALKTIQDKTVRDRKIRIIEIEKIEEIENPQIVFIAASEQDRLASILNGVKDKPILTVSDIEGFAERGGMINMYTLRNKIRIKINMTACEQADLSVSSRLLKLSQIVK